MKRILLFIIVLFGLLPVFEKGELSIIGGNKAYGQNVDYHLRNYLQAQDPTNNYQVSSHGCGCAVRVTDANGHFLGFVYATPQYVAANPQFSSYLQGQNVTPPEEPDEEEDDDSEYTMDDFLEDLQEMEDRMHEFEQMMEDFWTNAYGGGNEPLPPQERECIDNGSNIWEAAAEKVDIYNHQIGNQQTPCTVKKYLLKFKKVIKFSATQKARIQSYNFDGGTLISVTDIYGKVYINAQMVMISQSQTKCVAGNGVGNGGDGMDYFLGPKYVSDRYSSYKFICFDRLRTNLPHLLDQSLGVWENVPYNDIDYCIEVPETDVEDAVAGNHVIAPTSTGTEYCYQLTPEDVKLTTRVGRDDAYKVNGLNLDHYINIPEGIKKWFQKMGLMPSQCVIDYVNARLAELHADPTYVNNPSEAVKAVMEYENLFYDLLFGTLYCWTDEAAAQGKSAAAQYALGLIHEVVATLDVKEIVKGVTKLVENIGATIVQAVKEIIEKTKEDVEDQVQSNQGIDFERLAKVILKAISSQFEAGYNKIKQIAENFKKTYFTECDNDPQYGDICAYRYGQITAMVVPIVLTAGEWAIAKLSTLTVKYVARTEAALQLMNDAMLASRQVTNELYNVIDDVSQATVTIEKTVIKEGTVVKSTVKQEGLPGDEIIVISKADEVVDLQKVTTLPRESPNANNYLTKDKFKQSPHKIDPQVDPVLKTQADDIMANGDIGGTKTELISDHLYETKMGLTKLDGKYGSNNGIDGLYIEGTVSNPTRIHIVESKQQWNAGIKLQEANPVTGWPAQMSDAWIQSVANELEAIGKIAVANMLRNNPGIIEKYVLALNKSTGSINILRIN